MGGSCMADYRGTPKEDVIESLKNGVALLRRLDLGPAVEDDINTWVANRPYQAINSATDRKEVSQAMLRSGASHIFLGLSEIFRHHALIDTDGIGKSTYENLSKWGAFSGGTTAAYTPIDAEKDTHLVQQYAAITSEQLKAGETGNEVIQEKIDEVMNAFKDRNSGKEYEALENDLQNILYAAGTNDDKAIAATFLSHDLHGRHVIQSVFNYVSGLAEKSEEYHAPRVFSGYGIAVDGLPKNFGAMQQILDPIIDEASKILEPFYETDEVQRTMIGGITRDQSQSGFMFIATKVVAQTVADQMPDAKVIDYDGNVIAPSSNNGPADEQKPSMPKP